jgi:uncharacterized protein (TIGR00730 family)
VLVYYKINKLNKAEIMHEKIITVFGSARVAETDEEYQRAYEVGKELARAGFVICNGGFGGAMEASSRGAKDGGGKTIGVTFDVKSRMPNPWLDKRIHLPKLIDRMQRLIDMGDAYVVLKGGTGTLLELAAVWEFINKGISKEKPIVILGDFWSGVVEALRTESLWEGIGDCTKFIHRVESPKECAEYLKERLA